jgi:hypothetical protein
MTGPAIEWQTFGEAFERFRRRIGQSSSVNINSRELRGEGRNLALTFFQSIRPVIENDKVEELLVSLDSAFQNILVLSEGSNKKASYEKHLKRVKKVYPQITGRLAQHREDSKPAAAMTDEDRKIIATLDGLVPTAALSYKQATFDLLDDNRVSFRGAALELREALRETLDHLAPDKEVIAADGYVQEKDRHGPTMKQKVRFILKARGQKKGAAAAPEGAASAVEETIAGLTRTVYELSSVATHIALERTAVMRVRRYVVAVLHDILEI